MFGSHVSLLFNLLRDSRVDSCRDTMADFNSLYKKRNDSVDDDRVARPNLPPVTDPSYLELARIALCYYVAKADGVSPEEQAILDDMCTRLIDDPNTNPDYRYELRMILADKGKSFSNVRRYLNRIDPKELSQFKADVIRIAETTNGITENEKKALSVFYEYIASQNRSPVDDDGNEKAARTRIVSLKCQSCGASLEVGADQTLAYCPYCGSNHLIDKK